MKFYAKLFYAKCYGNYQLVCISTYFVLNKQPLFARLKPAGGTKRIAVIGKSTKHFGLCKSIRPDSTKTFFQHIPLLFEVEIESRNSRKLSLSIEDFGLHDEIAPSDCIQEICLMIA